MNVRGPCKIPDNDGETNFSTTFNSPSALVLPNNEFKYRLANDKVFVYSLNIFGKYKKYAIEYGDFHGCNDIALEMEDINENIAYYLRMFVIYTRDNNNNNESFYKQHL